MYCGEGSRVQILPFPRQINENWEKNPWKKIKKETDYANVATRNEKMVLFYIVDILRTERDINVHLNACA